MWTYITRKRHSRCGLRYPSDLRDDEWDVIEPLLPPRRTGGRPRGTDLREVVNAILYLATGGCQWRMLPKDFPPLLTVQRYFYAWRTMGLWQGNIAGQYTYLIVSCISHQRLEQIGILFPDIPIGELIWAASLSGKRAITVTNFGDRCGLHPKAETV